METGKFNSTCELRTSAPEVYENNDTSLTQVDCYCSACLNYKIKILLYSVSRLTWPLIFNIILILVWAYRLCDSGKTARFDFNKHPIPVTILFILIYQLHIAPKLHHGYVCLDIQIKLNVQRTGQT